MGFDRDSRGSGKRAEASLFSWRQQMSDNSVLRARRTKTSRMLLIAVDLSAREGEGGTPLPSREIRANDSAHRNEPTCGAKNGSTNALFGREREQVGNRRSIDLGDLLLDFLPHGHDGIGWTSRERSTRGDLLRHRTARDAVRSGSIDVQRIAAYRHSPAEGLRA